jgi:putative transmembrane protein
MTITQIILLQICVFILILVLATVFKRHQRIILWSAAIVIFTGTLLLVGLGTIDLIKDNRPNIVVIAGVSFAFLLSCALACGAEKLHAKNREKDKQTIQAGKNHPKAQNAPERVVLSGRLDTPLARIVFSKAVKAGYMEEAGSHYSWKGTKVLLAYMCGRIYCGDVPEYSKHEQKSFWKFGNGLFPDVELNTLFEQTEIGQSRQNRRDMAVPANAGDIDKLFSD